MRYVRMSFHLRQLSIKFSLSNSIGSISYLAERAQLPVYGYNNSQYDNKEEQKKLAAMGWHCITVWECELKPAKREETLDSIAFTLNHIWLQDRRSKMSDGRGMMYPQVNEEDMQLPMAAEDIKKFYE